MLAATQGRGGAVYPGPLEMQRTQNHAGLPDPSCEMNELLLWELWTQGGQASHSRKCDCPHGDPTQEATVSS